jgi:hypothetical protein
MSRPSVPLEEGRELQRQYRESLFAHLTGKDPNTPEGREWADRLSAAAKALVRAVGGLSLVGYAKWAFVFEDKPDACFEAVGDYRIERTGVTFSFMTDLPGDLNRFTIERSDPDLNGGRIFFTRGDCRFELTIGQSVLQNDEWLAVPLAPIRRTVQSYER